MKMIPLGKSGLFAMVDDEDYDMASKYKWCLNSKGYAHGTAGTGKMQALHRFILGLPPYRPFVDHKDRNPLNCTRNNLRICTPLENSRNCGPNKRNLSGYKGVTYRKKYNFYEVEIYYNEKSIYLGCYKCPIKAALAYDRAAKQYFKEFAYLNFPQEHTAAETSDSNQTCA